MAQRVPITVVLQNEKERALIEEVAHRLGESRSSFCREAILQAAVEFVDEMQSADEDQGKETV